jgi:hypothetical protein
MSKVKLIYEIETFKEELASMQDLVNTGQAWHLEGWVGRRAMELIKKGYIMLGKKGFRDAYGHYVPSRFEVQAGTKGSKDFVEEMARKRKFEFNPRTIGKKNISLVKELVRRARSEGLEGSYEIEQYVIGKLPIKLWETWEEADQEIRRIIFDYVSELAYKSNPKEKSPILAIYDNGGKTFDRYTVILSQKFMRPSKKSYYVALGLSFNPDSPQGFSQFGEAILGSHLGKKIPWNQLPERVRKHITRRLK